MDISLRVPIHANNATITPFRFKARTLLPPAPPCRRRCRCALPSPPPAASTATRPPRRCPSATSSLSPPSWSCRCGRSSLKPLRRRSLPRRSPPAPVPRLTTAGPPDRKALHPVLLRWRSPCGRRGRPGCSPPPSPPTPAAERAGPPPPAGVAPAGAACLHEAVRKAALGRARPDSHRAVPGHPAAGAAGVAGFRQVLAGSDWAGGEPFPEGERRARGVRLAGATDGWRGVPERDQRGRFEQDRDPADPHAGRHRPAPDAPEPPLCPAVPPRPRRRPNAPAAQARRSSRRSSCSSTAPASTPTSSGSCATSLRGVRLGAGHLAAASPGLCLPTATPEGVSHPSTSWPEAMLSRIDAAPAAQGWASATRRCCSRQIAGSRSRSATSRSTPWSRRATVRPLRAPVLVLC